MKINKKIVIIILMIAIAGDHFLVALGRELLIETLNLDPWVEVQLGEILEILQLFLSRYFYDEK